MPKGGRPNKKQNITSPQKEKRNPTIKHSPITESGLAEANGADQGVRAVEKPEKGEKREGKWGRGPEPMVTKGNSSTVGGGMVLCIEQ